ncbi:MAG TPA: DUF2917 domain-containing protein [Casimicrobiaceae bacterium]|nr:DUF2917 domain-containing protein [Casimicrobiaceae bacterium]
MACFETGTVVRLGSREAITLADIGGATLRVTRGTLWVTQERNPQDIVLRVGDNWAVERDGDTVIEAQGSATFCIVAPYDAAPIRLPARTGGTSWFHGAITALLHVPRRRTVPYF